MKRKAAIWSRKTIVEKHFTIISLYILGVSYSQKFRGKRGFHKLANGRTSQSRFPKYLIEYHNVRIESEIKI